MPYNVSTEQKVTFSNLYNYEANIIAYNGTTKIATLDAPVDVSIGLNNGQSIASQYTITGNAVNLSKAIQTNGVPTLSTDESGNFVGIFNIPGDTFLNGQRVFRVDNRTGDDITSSTTWAEATFTSSGLSEKISVSNFSPSIDSAAANFVQVNQQSQQLIENTNIRNYGDPVAQTFIVSKDNFPNGLFLQSVKFFFKSKPTQNVPVVLSVIGTLNGYPNGKKLDYSTVVKDTSDILVSSNPHYLDPTTYTEFMFDAPIYIQPGVLYAFMLETHSSDYQIYYAQQNQTAILSTSKNKPSDPNPSNASKVGSAPYIGSLFESQNGQTWTADQTKSLMFVVDRCIFDTTQTPQIEFSIPKNLPTRKIGTNDIQYSLDPNNLSGLVHEFTFDTVSDAYNLTTTDFIPSKTNISYAYSSILADGNTPIGPFPVSPGKNANPTANNIYLNDGKGERILLKSYANSFVMTATLNSSDPNLSPIISDDGVSLYNIRYIVNNMGIGNNVISLVSGGSGYNVQTTTVLISEPDVGTDTAILGLNITDGVITGVYSSYVGSGYITTPTISIVDSNGTPGTGASAVVSGETSPTGGNAYSRYISKKVILTPANESGDLRVFLSAYRPSGSNIYVYYKILNSNDTSNFDDLNWQLMTPLYNNNTYSSTREDIIEYEYAPGTNNAADNFISYTNPENVTYTSYNQFAIKIVIATPDNTQVPFLQDMRAIALPSGTGI